MQTTHSMPVSVKTVSKQNPSQGNKMTQITKLYSTRSQTFPSHTPNRHSTNKSDSHVATIHSTSQKPNYFKRTSRAETTTNSTNTERHDNHDNLLNHNNNHPLGDISPRSTSPPPNPRKMIPIPSPAHSSASGASTSTKRNHHSPVSSRHSNGSNMHQTPRGGANSLSPHSQLPSTTSKATPNRQLPKHSQSYYLQLAHRLMHSHDGVKKQRLLQKRKQELKQEETWFRPNSYESMDQEGQYIQDGSFSPSDSSEQGIDWTEDSKVRNSIGSSGSDELFSSDEASLDEAEPQRPSRKRPTSALPSRRTKRSVVSQYVDAFTAQPVPATNFDTTAAATMATRINPSKRPSSAPRTRRRKVTKKTKRSATPHQPVYKRVHHDLLLHSQKMQKLRAKHDNTHVHCTFKPKISKRSEEIAKKIKRRNSTPVHPSTNHGADNHEFNFAARETVHTSQHMKQLLKEMHDRQSLSEKPQISKYSQEIIKNNPLYQKDIKFLDRQRFLAIESERARLQNEETYAPSFQPEISKRSTLMMRYMRKRGGRVRRNKQDDLDEIVPPSPSKQAIAVGKDDLFGYYQARDSLGALSHLQKDPRCSFKPQINEYSKSIAKSHSVEELIQFAKEREARIAKQQKFKEKQQLKQCTFKPKLEAKKATEQLVRKSLSRDPSSPTIKEKNQLWAKLASDSYAGRDEQECTFKPRINSKFVHDPAKSIGFSNPELRTYDFRTQHKKKPIVKGLDTFFERMQRRNQLKFEEEVRKRERLNDTTNPAKEEAFVSNHELDRIREMQLVQ